MIRDYNSHNCYFKPMHETAEKDQRIDMGNPKPEMIEIFELQKKKALELRKTSARERIRMLKDLKEWMLDHQPELQKALYEDFKKPIPETDLTEFYLVKAEINHAIKHLERWMQPRKVATPLPLIGSQSTVRYEPKGVCLIIAPWNYPFSLLVAPFVSAIAAGNTVMLKPSEMTPQTSSLIKKMIAELFPIDVAVVFEGGIEISTQLLELPFDHIFFTGSPSVGKIVMGAASKHLTSVTLELGGKSPNIIDETANLKDAVEKLVFNKFLNAGQTCVAPDYVFIHSSKEHEFLDLLKSHVTKVYNDNEEDLAGIIHRKHFDHLEGLLTDALDRGAELVYGGQSDKNDLRMEPIILRNINETMKIMEEEVFGPIIPVLNYDSLDQVIDFVNVRPKPLALYFFSRKKANIKRILKETSSGTACINDAVIQFTNNNLPFGGVNSSGMGKSHGEYGFKTFSNAKGVLHQRVGFTSVSVLYPPYTKRVRKYIELLLRWL